MKNRWQQSRAEAMAAAGPLGLRVYSSNLLGQDTGLVLHGGGNTSMKGTATDVFGETRQVLFVKGSGWDLRSIEAPGFPAVNLDHLLRLSRLEALSDTEMMRQLRLGLLDPTAPTPSVEAILHALIPLRYVDHTHADAVVTLSNTPNGEARLRELFGDDVLILPYRMPGFLLARQVLEATRGLEWKRLQGIVLLSHGVFTFADEAEHCYARMIELVSRAEACLQQLASPVAAVPPGPGTPPSTADALALSALRRDAGALLGQPCLARLDTGTEAAAFAQREEHADLIQRGPLTPDHTIHAKAFGAVFAPTPAAGLARFDALYRDYFATHSQPHHQMLDPVPRYGVWPQHGMIYLGANHKRLQVVSDISQHTLRAIRLAEAAGGWSALPRADLFAVEYWELEQAKLKTGAARASFEGQIALVTGAASGIGRACCEALLAAGAVVIALDVAAGFTQLSSGANELRLRCDVTDSAAIEAALRIGVLHFGGLDLVVSNAGNFPPGARIEDLTDEVWEATLALNLSAHMRVLRAAVPYLKLGFTPAAVMVASKNVPAPGPGVSAYSAAKAGLTQLARVAALELGPAGIRVNVVHPNAVYDTGIWSDSMLAERAAYYGKSVEAYRRANVLQTELDSSDVARSVLALLSGDFAKTTGAQVPIDGGNERVI